MGLTRFLQITAQPKHCAYDKAAVGDTGRTRRSSNPAQDLVFSRP